ncbi:hypothetical protein M8J75_007289 [Diaphorina citri]|nr:hypothetical protein M8J75_007289 [Diaphorina citri]
MHTELAGFVHKNDIDILLLQEPYTSNTALGRRIPVLQKNARVAFGKVCETDGRVYSCVMAANPRMGVMEIPRLTCEYLTVVQGAILERFISAHDLRVHNTPNLLTTFQSHAGQTNIDVTLSTRDIPVPVVRWDVHDDATSSNHRLITFSLEVDSGTEEADEDRMRFNLKDADWGKFDRVLHTKLSQAPPVEPGLSQKDFIDSTVAELTKVYQNTCTETLKRTRLPRYKKTIWWSFRLERMKKRNVRLRRTYQRTMDADLRAQRASVWRAFQAGYKNAIREARENSCERATLDDLQKNPFGMLYKTSAKKYSCKRKGCQNGRQWRHPHNRVHFTSLP